MKIIPSGLMLDSIKTEAPYENVELRATLEKAVDDADLTTSERWALNKKFYPNGGGFELFPKGKDTAVFSYHLKPGKLERDVFEQIEIPKGINMVITEVDFKKSANTYKDNLSSALKKLGEILKGKI